jgi:hypothetical protein
MSKTTPTTLLASAKALSGRPDASKGDADVPPHVAPFKPFDWTAGGDAPGKPISRDGVLLREVLNNTINIVTGAVLCLRIVEQCNLVGETGPGLVDVGDGLLLEQPSAPYLNVSDCAMLQTMVGSMLAVGCNAAN